MSMARNEKFGCREAKASADEPEWESLEDWGFDYDANEMVPPEEGREAAPEEEGEQQEVQHGESMKVE